MSFVNVLPEYVDSAAQALSGLHSTVSQAAAAAAAPTTGIAVAGADEVSAAIAGLFGEFGQEFQGLAGQASAFHSEFVSLLSAGAGAYLSADVANAQQTLASAAATGGGSGLAEGLQSFGATVAGPYQQLFANTEGNIQSLLQTMAANPAPLLNQVLVNQAGYVTAIGNSTQYFPANMLTALQTAVQNPPNVGALLQGFVNNQVGYLNTMGSSLNAAGSDFVTGLAQLPTAFQSAFQQALAGNFSAALSDVSSGLGNLFITGFASGNSATGGFTFTPTGPLGDLLPILGIPGEMAQNFTNILPAGSIVSQVSQNFTNLISTSLDNGLSSGPTQFVFNPATGALSVVVNTTTGMPLTLLLEAAGAPLSTVSSINTVATTFATNVQSGNVAGALATVLDSPAIVANGFLNGQTTLPLQIQVLDPAGEQNLTIDLSLPMNGVLAAPTAYSGTVTAWGSYGGTDFSSTFPARFGGTPVGGIIPGLLTYLPADLAAAIGGPAAPTVVLSTS